MSSLQSTLVAVLLVAFVAFQSLASKPPAVPTINQYCTTNSECNGAATNQVCFNGTFICDFGLTWDNDHFMCTDRPCQRSQVHLATFGLLELQLRHLRVRHQRPRGCGQPDLSVWQRQRSHPQKCCNDCGHS